MRLGQPVDLGEMSLVDLTRFLACRLTDIGGEVSVLFSTGLLIDGLPPERQRLIPLSQVALNVVCLSS